jgi:glucokinase
VAQMMKPRLLADIGSQYARFAIEREPGVFEERRALRCSEFGDFNSALRAYLNTIEPHIRHCAIAISNPVEGDWVSMTNYKWKFSIEATRQAVGFETLVVVNDFTALAMGLPYLHGDEYRRVGGGEARERAVIGLIGSGSGLGVSALIPVEDGWVSLASEGGHSALSPQSAREVYILEYAWRQYPHVSAERLLSGSGIELMYRALADRGELTVEPLEAPEITRRALAGEDPLCREVLDVFCEMLGTAAANVAVTFGAYGGIFVGGSIVPRLGAYFDRSGFRARFEAKGRFSGYVARIPTFVLTAETPTLTGTSAILSAQLKKRAAVSTLLDRVAQGREALSTAEQRVADLVLAEPRSVLSDPIVDIARRAGVSQPTVVRFCRSLGCAGLSDFKLKLASGLTGTIPVSHTQVRRTDSPLELGSKVLDNTAAALLKLRESLNSAAVDRAIEKLVAARRIDFYAVGNYAVVANDAQLKLLHFGRPTMALTDARLQAVAVRTLTADDVVVAFSGSGKITDLVKAVDAAVETGAFVIAICPSQSPLAKRASLAIAIDHSEDVSTQIPMISRILHLALIDILAVGIAMRVGTVEEHSNVSDDEEAPQRARPARPDYSRITSHSG